MILKALDEGASEERIAWMLNIDTATIRKTRNLLEGICPEAVEELRNTRVSSAALRELKRVVPLRQIEMAELMIAARNVTASYAKCLYAGSRPYQLLVAGKLVDNHCLSPEEMSHIRGAAFGCAVAAEVMIFPVDAHAHSRWVYGGYKQELL